MNRDYVQVTVKEWECKLKEVDEIALQEFSEWLQGEKKIDRMHFVEQPKLSRQAAFSVIYYLQERLGILSDDYEMCQTCGCIYDSANEGTCINDDTEIVNDEGEWVDANFPEEKYGFYCENCRPD